MSMRALAVVLLAAPFVLGDSFFTGQTLRTSRVMWDKLAHAQNILEGLTTSNYALLDRETESLSRVVDSPEWDELKMPEFRGYTETFTDAARAIAEGSRRRDLDAAAKAYESLVASCYSCHRYRRGARIAEPPR